MGAPNRVTGLQGLKGVARRMPATNRVAGHEGVRVASFHINGFGNGCAAQSHGDGEKDSLETHCDRAWLGLLCFGVLCFCVLCFGAAEGRGLHLSLYMAFTIGRHVEYPYLELLTAEYNTISRYSSSPDIIHGNPSLVYNTNLFLSRGLLTYIFVQPPRCAN